VIRTTVNNPQGPVAQVYESPTATCGTTGTLTSYTYDAFGDLMTVVDAASHMVANNSYDIRGRKTTSIDADMGTWTYVYDGFGELYSQTDAKGQLASFTYDALGRVLTHTELGLTSAYVYDTASGKGIGQPASASASPGSATHWLGFNWNGADWSGGSYARTFTYDTLGRPSTLTLTQDGVAGVYTLTYDANGRAQTVAYPSGFTAKYAYTSLGYLSQISDNSSGTVFWTANTRDAELHLLTQTQGSGVTTTQAFDPNTGLVQSILAGAGAAVANQTFTFDSLGRLTARTWLNNAGAAVRENSCFDGLNRLTSTLVTTPTGTACTGSGAVTVAYDALGNITQKSDVCSTANGFVYGGSGAGPHALTSIVGTYNGVANPAFTYDANGLMTAGAGRTVTATSFDMAARITDGANTAAFGYDPEHARYKMVTGGANGGTTYYLNDTSSGAMEEKSIVAGVTTWRDYIMVEGRMVAERFCTGAAPCASGAATLNYFVLDHLGSIAVIVNATGSVLNRLSYDAWGKRRNADGSALNCTAGLTSPSSVTRGFTGQEMLDGLCLVNLNARVYDPSLGRFMAADPMVGDETVPQELNRYSYVLNDPLSLTDPSGLCGFWCIFRDVLAIVVAIVLEQPEVSTWIDGQLGLTGFAALQGVDGFVNAGIAGRVSGFIATGTLKGAALGVLQAGLFNAAGNALQTAGSGGFAGIGHIPSEFIAHGLVGGLVSEIGGGKTPIISPPPEKKP
jgi:RHS repeat-associated protein